MKLPVNLSLLNRFLLSPRFASSLSSLCFFTLKIGHGEPKKRERERETKKREETEHEDK